MSGMQQAVDPIKPTDLTQPDPADPATTVDAIRGQLEQAERNYQANLARERARTTQAENRAATVTDELQTARQDRASLEFSTVSNALDAAKSSAESLQGQYAAAMETGDFKRAGEIGLEIGRVGARIEQFEQAKQQMEAQRNEALRNPPRPEPAVQSQTAGGDPIEADLAKRDARAAAWIRTQTDASGKPRFYTDPAFQNRVISAHHLARAEGLTENSPEYFQFVEGNVGVSGSNSGNNAENGNGTRQLSRGGVPLAAPVRNAGNYRDNQGRGAGHIPAEAVRVAKSMGLIKPEEIKAYWDESRRMARNGEFKAGDPFQGAV